MSEPTVNVRLTPRELRALNGMLRDVPNLPDLPDAIENVVVRKVMAVNAFATAMTEAVAIVGAAEALNEEPVVSVHPDDPAQFVRRYDPDFDPTYRNPQQREFDPTDQDPT